MGDQINYEATVKIVYDSYTNIEITIYSTTLDELLSDIKKIKNPDKEDKA